MSNVPDGGRIAFLFSDFDAGLDFTAITAMQVSLTPTASPVDCSIGALRTSPFFEDSGTLAWSTAFPSGGCCPWSPWSSIAIPIQETRFDNIRRSG